MAITRIYGFQQFDDYLGVEITNFTPFGKLPFHSNSSREPSRWEFKRFEERVWLYSKTLDSTNGSNTSTAGARNSNRNANLSVSLNFPLRSVYGDLLEDVDCKRFTLGCRFTYPFTGTRRPSDPLMLKAVGGNTISTSGVTLLSMNETPNVQNVVFYIEVTIDLQLGVAQRWLDSVRLTDIPLNETIVENIKDYHFHFGQKSTSSVFNASNRNDFGINDLYFIADTSHLNDGTPTGRLGPIEVEALRPKTVQLPDTWNNETGKDPAEFLKETEDTTNMRGRPALVSDEAGDRAVVEFEEPEFKEGEILYCELEAYGYRNFGDNVALNTRVVQGNESDEPKHHEVEPERLRVGANTIFPAKLHRPLDGEEWTEQKLGNIKLELWSTKPE